MIKNLPSSQSSSAETSSTALFSNLVIYVASGVTQPLILSFCAHLGVNDPTAQLYMLFYYLGPALYIVALLHDKKEARPSWNGTVKSMLVAAFDVIAQALNYTGASMAGADIFALVYSSVTIWTAIFSRVLLQRSMSWSQWFAVCVVFGGLLLTATGSISLGPSVAKGTAFVFVGSCMHGLTYVMNEAIMRGKEQLDIYHNIGIQGVFGFSCFLAWQLVYTFPRFDELVLIPIDRTAGSSIPLAFFSLMSFGFANFVHSGAFYHTLKYFPCGATTAGVMKALQAVLVFVAAHFLFCGSIGGEEMCFSAGKFVSLVAVVSGVCIFGFATERARAREGYLSIESEAILGDEAETSTEPSESQLIDV